MMRLYHTSTVEIRQPDIRRGRKNADFGQGFYLTPDRAFAVRSWRPIRRPWQLGCRSFGQTMRDRKKAGTGRASMPAFCCVYRFSPLLSITVLYQ